MVRINFIKIIKSWDIKYVLGLFTCNTAFDIDGYAVYFGHENAQTVLGWTAHKVREPFALFAHPFLPSERFEIYKKFQDGAENM